MFGSGRGKAFKISPMDDTANTLFNDFSFFVKDA